MTSTRIEWATEVWNPVTGCAKVSDGCRHCFAATFAARGMGHWKGRRFEEVRLHMDRLNDPLKWHRPRRVFVNSMGDLFHRDVPSSFIGDVFSVMARAHWHRFIVLTKRPERMVAEYVDIARDWMVRRLGALHRWPLSNVALGVSVEDQASADERVPLLLETPAACRLVSYEPALGPVDFSPWLRRAEPRGATGDWQHRQRGLDAIILGGESGPGARPCEVDWLRAGVRQCREAGAAAFVKQLGACPVIADPPRTGLPREQWPEREWPEGTCFGNRTGRRELNGRVALLASRKGSDPAEWPEDLRVRELPAVLWMPGEGAP